MSGFVFMSRFWLMPSLCLVHVLAMLGSVFGLGLALIQALAMSGLYFGHSCFMSWPPLFWPTFETMKKKKKKYSQFAPLLMFSQFAPLFPVH